MIMCRDIWVDTLLHTFTIPGVGGLDGDGNVYSPDNLRVFRKFVMDSTDNKGVHFVMADGVCILSVIFILTTGSFC